jgi:hypothetical protein
MILSISKFKLYYPNGDSEYGGGGDEGGAKESDPSSDPGTSTPTGTPSSSGGGSIGNTIQSSFLSKRKKQATEISKDKVITQLLVGVPFIIPEGGKTGMVRIKGTPGAMFSITIEDSTGCSILKEDKDNIAGSYKTIPNSGFYEFEQTFPSIFVGVSTTRRTSKTSESYTITITPAADVKLASNAVDTMTINQYADPTINVTHTTSQTGPTLSVSGSAIKKIGNAGASGRNMPGYSATTWALTLTAGVEDDGVWYVNRDKANFNSAISTSTVIKKKIDRCGGTGEIRTLILDPLTTRTESSIEGEDKTTGDLQNGMLMRAKVEKTKTVVANLDDNNNILDFNTCKNKATERFKLSDTNDIVEGMAIILRGKIIGLVESVVCGTTIKTSYNSYIPRDTVLTFRSKWHSTIHGVINNNDKGQTQASIMSAVDIPHGTEIEFDDNANQIGGIMKHSGSGTDSITLTTTINVEKFGYKDVTYTLDLDEFITRTPNAYDRYETTAKETAVTIDMIKGDYDSNATSKTGTVVKQPQNGEVGSYAASTDSFTYTPAKGFIGEDFFTYMMSDDLNRSEEKTVFITVK